jgi:phosphonate transport system ATP-binding protein
MPRGTTPVVDLREARVRFGQRTVLDLSLQVMPGERVAVVGPSGAGKSTLLGLCSGSRPLDRGSVQVLGTDLAGASRRRLRAVRSRIGTVHQQLHLVGRLSARQNVSAGRLGRWSLARSLLSLVSLQDRGPVEEALERLGIAELAGHRTEDLSGGEQQRVALARVLVQDPPLVLADEPIASLDPQRARAVMDLLAEVVGDGSRALLVSLHDADVARETCDRVLGLRAGRIVLDVPAEEFTPALRERLYRIGT